MRQSPGGLWLGARCGGQCRAEIRHQQLHGSAYAYGRYTAWDAKSPYLGPLPKADDLFEQFGGSIGGPIIKDKLFYFGNYEGFRYTVGVPGNPAGS